MWHTASETLSSDIRNKISTLEAATQDCRRLSTMASKLTSDEGRPFSPRAFSPPPARSASPEIEALKETNKRLQDESRRRDLDAAVRIDAAEKREQEWSALCKEWQSHDTKREEQWKNNISAILFDE
eukprot:TRINITY_DN15700_c0_g1_i1.p1 TRINITY_DN15700_c0_g1~~TRINITY_DN15700_c0_g1_i1.p1  ORF type:complete len:136 (+),score=30.07 TRINITY_DN15700_c0_g1_i1:29-409(+)